MGEEEWECLFFLNHRYWKRINTRVVNVFNQEYCQYCIGNGNDNCLSFRGTGKEWESLLLDFLQPWFPGPLFLPINFTERTDWIKTKIRLEKNFLEVFQKLLPQAHLVSPWKDRRCKYVMISIYKFFYFQNNDKQPELVIRYRKFLCGETFKSYNFLNDWPYKRFSRTFFKIFFARVA